MLAQDVISRTFSPWSSEVPPSPCERRTKSATLTDVDLIVSHTNADFDALASMVAASLLYPTALMSLPGGADRNVREFLALHADVIHLVAPHDVPVQQVTRLIVVETQHARRLGRFAALIGRRGVTVILYDHHLPDRPTVQADEVVIAAYGANVTLMIEHLRQRRLVINPLQATLFALGIYEDTGSLTFTSTTPDDVDTVAWLLRQGANLDVIATFMNRALTQAQRTILNQLLASAEVVTVQGIQLLVATAVADGYPDDIALLAHKLHELERSDAVVMLVQIHDTVQLVARSSVEAVSAAKIARHFGGGGHTRAASATIHHRPLEAVRLELDDVLERVVRPRVTAATLMSFPVRTISPNTSIDDAAQLMLRYGHGGLTVVDQEQVVGMIHRREVDRARHHGLGHAPVRGYMTRTVMPIAPATPLPEIERLMIEHNIGRLPVLDHGQLVGIVTRTDVLRAIHSERYGARQALYRSGEAGGNIRARYQQQVSAKQQALLTHVAATATAMGVTVFLVGGTVRDLLLGNPNIDLDILVEGEAIPLAERVARELHARVVTHAKFHTGTVTMPDETTLDFATARTEYYQYPAALPTAEHSSVREDLSRRDFTMNAMAMQLNGDEPGRLLDPFGGGQDLRERTIRVLHTLSFVEDPTRILRAVRFDARFAFHMDERTDELARQAVAMGLLDRVSGDRIREELLLLFTQPYPASAVRRLADLGVMNALEPGWRLPETLDAYDRLEETLAWAAHEPAVAAHRIDPAHQRLLLLFAPLTPDAIDRLIARLHPGTKFAQLARQLPTLHEHGTLLDDPALRPSEVETQLRRVPIPLCLVLMATTESANVRRHVMTYLTTWRHLHPLITGDDLKRLEVPRGPVYTRLMRAIRAAQLDGFIHTRDEALTLAQRLLASQP